jgi:hypothetical protein
MGVHRWAVLPGESVIWEGRPTRFLWMSRADLPLVLLAAGYAVVVPGYLLVGGPGDLGYVVLVMIFVGVAVLWLGGQPLWRALQLRRTRYALTTHRLFILDSRLIAVPRMYSLGVYGSPVVRLGAGGVGSLALGAFPSPVETLFTVTNRGLSGLFGPAAWPRPVLWHIRDVEHVRGLVEGSRRRSIAVGARLGHPAPPDAD